MKVFFFVSFLYLFFSCAVHRPKEKGGDIQIHFLEQKFGFAITRNDFIQLYEYTSKWLGVPYRYGGNDMTGVDCSGFVCQVYRNVYHKILPRTTREEYNTLTPVKQNHIREGDLVFFSDDSGQVAHVGIYLKEDR